MPRLSKDFIIRAGLLACLVAFVLGARWAAVNRFGSDLPQWDQWDAEALHSLMPWFTHHFFIRELFLPHNEHRVVITKLLNLGLTLADGQWDQRLECAVNALLPALIAAGFFILGTREFSRRWQFPLVLLLMAAFGLPFSWQNILGGFHSQQFFLIGFSFACIVWLSFAPPGSPRWWLGAICGLLALGSMASGLLAGVVVVAIVFDRRRRGEISWRAVLPTLALCAALICLGWFTRVDVSYHESLKAHSAKDFAMTVIRSMQWPGSATPWLAVLFWTPCAWLVVRVLSRNDSAFPRGGRTRSFGLILAGLGTWVFLQLLATAYARGAGGPAPSSRYIDTLVFGQVVNALALPWLCPPSLKLRKAAHLAFVALGLAWLAAFGLGAAGQVEVALAGDLPAVGMDYAKREPNVRSYIATDDDAYLENGPIPYPSYAALLERIRLPQIRALLPVSVRRPLTLEAASGAGGFLGYDSRSKWGAPPPAAAGESGVSNGLSPTTAPLTNRIMWGSFGENSAQEWSEWESEPVQPTGSGWLKFEIAGLAATPGVTLELRDAKTRAILADVRPRKVPGNAWRTVYVPEPSDAFVVAARGGPQHWLAFGEPVEMGRLSYWAWRIVRNGLLIAELAAGAVVLLALGAALDFVFCRRFAPP